MRNMVFRSSEAVATTADKCSSSTRARYLHKLGIRRRLGLVVTSNSFAFDLELLQHQAMEMGMTAISRPLVWMILLRVLPARIDLWEFAQKNLQEEYEDIQAASTYLHQQSTVCQDDATRDDVELSLAVRTYLGLQEEETQTHRYGTIEKQRREVLASGVVWCVRIFRSLLGQDTSSTFWCTVAFMQGSGSACWNRSALVTQVESFGVLLRSHCRRMHHHLQQYGIRVNDFAPSWFRTCLASALPPHMVLSIVDRCIASNGAVMPYIAVTMCRRFSPHICTLQSRDAILSFFFKFPEFDVEGLILHAMDQHKTHVRMQCHICSPTTIERPVVRQAPPLPALSPKKRSPKAGGFNDM